MPMRLPTKHGLERLCILGVSALILFVACETEDPTGVSSRPAHVIRGAGCSPRVIVTSSETTDTTLVTFDDPNDAGALCGNLVPWGIDMADPLGVDTPQGDGNFTPRIEIGSNPPSPPTYALGANYTPPQVMIEFDPPISSAEFYYSRLLGGRAYWNGQLVYADSMRIFALSRRPGTLSYTQYDSKVLYANVPSTTPPWSVWTKVKLRTLSGTDQIQWLWFDGGPIAIDNLKITRTKPDTAFHVFLSCTPLPVVRVSNINCAATWTPATIPVGEINFAWRFKPDSVLVFPSSTAQAYDPPAAIDSSGGGMATWQGKAVLDGVSRVIGTWQGQTDTAETQVVVSPRTVAPFGDLPVTFAKDTVDIATDLTHILTDQPDPDGGPTLGVAGQNYDTATNSGGLSTVIHGQPWVARVPSGPNSGLYYVTAPGVNSTRGAKVRTWLTGRTPLLFRYSLSTPLLTNRGLLAARRKTLKSKQPMHPDSLLFLTGVWSHETYGRLGAKGHQGQIELAAKSLPTCGRVPAILERVVAADSGTVMFRASDVKAEGMKSLYAASWHDNVYGNYSNASSYEVVSQTTNADNLSWLTIRGDIQQAQNPTLAPDQRWGCTRVY